MADTYRRSTAGSPSDLLAQLKGLSGKSPKTYAALAAVKLPNGQTRQDQKLRDPRPPANTSAFFGRESPSPDLLSKVAALMKQTAAPSDPNNLGLDRSRVTQPLASARSTPEDMFGGAAPRHSESGSSKASPFPRPASVALHEGSGRGTSTRPSITPELPSAFSMPSLAGHSITVAAELASRSRRRTTDGQGQDTPSQPAAPPAWSEELLNWMLAEKSELLLEVQRAQRRQHELQQELDRARATARSGAEDEVQRLKVERRLLLEKLQRFSQQDAQSSALLERIQMENDALTTELERSQEVCKEMLAARRAARDALSEMSAQNARLVSAYVEKKQEAAQLKEEMWQQQRHAEVRIRALEGELHAAQAQCLELHCRLQRSTHHLAHSSSMADVPSPPSAGRAAGLHEQDTLPEPSPAYMAGSTLGEDMSDLEFASPFSSPVRHRTPVTAQQHGKENASWSGNRGSASAARRKPASAHGSEGDATAVPGPPPSGQRVPAKGEWDKERSELLTLLERLQHQLSAHAEQQATPTKQQPAEPHCQQPQQQERPTQPQPDAAEQAVPTYHHAVPLPGGELPSIQPAPFSAESMRASPSPSANSEHSSPAGTPPSHCSAPSTGPTPRHSHFSVPRHSGSSPMHTDNEYGTSGSSKHSSQTAALHNRRASGVNLSKAFEGACSADTDTCPMYSSDSDSDAEGDGGQQAFRPASMASEHLSSPSASSAAGTPLGMPASLHMQPSPIIPPMATPFAVHPPEAARARTQPQRSLQQHPADAAAPPLPPSASASDHGTPESQRLADVEKRNAALEAELQRLRQLQQAADERMKEEELQRQIDQYKQAGNAAFQQQRYEQAAQEYTAGIDLSGSATTSSPAVLYCNRAAALHAMGRYLDAVADCFRAEKKDPTYARLYHRRADAYCAIGAYDAASQDMAKLVEMGCGREVQARLQEVQHKLKAHYPVNHYAVLGVKSAATPSEVKSAYRSLALKFHPDKAGQLLPHEAADAIFKLVTAANATLSDAEKRRAHDLQALRHKYRRFYSYHF